MRKRWYIPISFFLLALLLVGIGGLWGVIAVGVPYQDATPAQQAYESFHLAVSGYLCTGEFISFALAKASLIGLIVYEVMGEKKKTIAAYTRTK